MGMAGIEDRLLRDRKWMEDRSTVHFDRSGRGGQGAVAGACGIFLGEVVILNAKLRWRGSCTATPEFSAFSKGWQYNCHPNKIPIVKN